MRFSCGTVRVYGERYTVIGRYIMLQQQQSPAAASQRDVKWAFSVDSYRTAAESVA